MDKSSPFSLPNLYIANPKGNDIFPKKNQVEIVVAEVEGGAEIRIRGGTPCLPPILEGMPNENHILSSSVAGSSSTAAMLDQVVDYLRTNPDFLERYVLDQIDVEQLERWIIRKSQRLKKSRPAEIADRTENSTSAGRKTSLSRWKFCVHADKRQMLQDLTSSLQQKPTKEHVLLELANCISSAVNADGFRLYLIDRENSTPTPTLCRLDGSGAAPEPVTAPIPLYVSKMQEPIRLSIGDSRFPRDSFQEAKHILCQPLMQPDGQLAAVLELRRGQQGSRPFYEEDEEIASSYLVWGGIALHYADLYFTMTKQRRLNDFVLDVVKSIFQDMVSIEALVLKIMNFAQKLVDADRASLFLVDAKTSELYATVFDVGVAEGEQASEEIRFPLGTGIAGHVALTGDVLNIRDAYADTRFNRNVDQLTGYKTNTILCMPIYIRSVIIGVVQMVNKRSASGFFSSDDEEAFKMFAMYCGLALHHAKLYDKIRRSEQKYKVALEVLSYHNTATDQEYEMALVEGVPSEKLPDLDTYHFNPFVVDDFRKALCAVYMFKDLFGLMTFDSNSLMRFTLTVKKNYRRVPYHNWTHGFSVANTMYTIIKQSKGVFRRLEALALFISALCHDLDHRGKNNQFMLDTSSPLAAIYSTSTLEHHHFNQTVTILQQEGHNIFAKLSGTEYKQILGYLKHCILATDLARFFPNRQKLQVLVEQDLFTWSNMEHRLLVDAITMTACDLSASAKPWDIQAETVKVIFEEFYEQGDEERAAGRDPIPMMDRQRPEEQARSQVGFLTTICIPCYRLLNHCLPGTGPLLQMCQRNLNKWRMIDTEASAPGPVASNSTKM